VTPSILREVTLNRFGMGRGMIALQRRRVKMISLDLDWLRRRFFSAAHLPTLASSKETDMELLANMIKQQSSAYLHISLPSVHGVRSAAVTMKAAGHKAEPWITLAEILDRLELEPLNLWQWEWSMK